VACLVKSRVDPSEYVPVAVSCLKKVRPGYTIIDELPGKIAIDCRTIALAVNAVFPETPTKLAVMVVVPAAVVVASP